MSTNFENSEEKIVNLSMEDMIFVDDIISENKIIINSPLVDVCGNDLNRAGMLTRYVYFYKLNKFQPFALTDKKMAEHLHLSVDKIEHGKAWLKTHNLLFVDRKGIPAVGYITPNISKIKELYKQMESSSAYLRNWSGICAEHIYNIEERDIIENIKENTKRSLETEKNIPASGSPSSPDVDEFRLAEEVFENRFWVLVPNKVGKEKAKQRFFRITNNCKNEKKVNEVVEGYKRYLSFLAKNKANNFNRRPKDPATFLIIENKLWLEPWEFNEDEVVLSAGGSRIKQPENWKNRISIAKRLGLLENFEREEINDMYNKEWKFVPNEAKQAIASEKVDVEYKECVEQKRKREIELKEKTLKKREKEVECQNLGEKLKQLEFEIKKPFLSWIEETFDLSSLIKDFKMHMLLKFAVPENVSEFSMLKFYKDELWMSSEIDRMLEKKLGDDKEFVEKKQEYENELKKHDEEFKKHRELVKELEDLDKDITNLALEQQKFNNQ